MLIRNTLEPGRSGESGGALVAAVTVVATVGMLSAMTFQLNQSTWQRQLTENNKKRAFYLAESGIAESMAALTMGLGGNVASQAEPAMFGEGYVFSEVLEDQHGLLHVDSYGICGDARHHLAVVLGKLHVPLAREGFFGDEFVRVGSSALIDSTADPASGGGSGDTKDAGDGRSTTPEPPAPAPDPERIVKTADVDMEKAEMLRREGENWKVAWKGGGDFQQNAWDQPEVGGEKYASGVPLGTGDERPSSPTDTTAKLGSNGPITIEPGLLAPTLIDASVHPGPGEVVTPGVGVTITGATTPRITATVLPTLEAPVLTPAGDLTLTRGATLLLNEPYLEYGAISLEATTVLTLAGPAQVVCTTLSLANAAALVVDSSGGPVEIHVMDSFSMGPAAELQSPTADATGLLIYVHGQDALSGTPEKVTLAGSGTFHGLLYAPLANLDLPSSMSFVGSVIGRTLTVESGTSLSFEPALLNESYSALEFETISWRIGEVPVALRRNNYDPDGDYRSAGRTPPLLSDSWQMTEQIIHYTDLDGNDFIYRGNNLSPMPLEVAVVIDNMTDTDPLFTSFETAPGLVQALQVP